MKITHVIPFYAPAWGYGGPVRVCYDLTRSLAKAGHQATVLTTDAYDHTKRIDQVCEELDKVKIFRSRNLSNRLAKNYNLFIPKGFSKLCKQNIKNADVVHLHSFYTILNIIAAKYARKYKVPYIIHLHELPTADPMFGKVIIKKIFIALWGRKMLTKAASILVLTQNEKELTLKGYPFLREKIEILPNPIDQTKRPKVEPSLRKKYGYSEKDKILLSLSRLSNLKRVDKVIKGFAEILKSDPSFRLIVAGPDEMGNLAKLQKMAMELQVTDKVKFTGTVTGKKKEEAYQLADLYVLLAEYESFSIATLEAMSYGLVPILSRGVGLAKDLDPLGAAAVLKTDSTKEFADTVIKIYDRRSSYANGMSTAIMKFSLNNVLMNLITIYKKLDAS